MKSIFLVFFTISSTLIIAQEQINGSFAFQSDPSKDYSIVLPSSYADSIEYPVFLALHPFNTSVWNANTWCQELSEFAETNGLVLICPDGGPDGKIDDAIDTAFTSLLLDSAFIWYSLDEHNLYATGFSWGGKTTYTYGLNHIDKFKGLMPIGAAVNINEVNGIASNIDGKNVYVIHGSNDSPNTRYFPLVEAMEDNGGCVGSNLLPGVGHTINFPNQLEVLTTGYEHLRDCMFVNTENETIKESILLYTVFDQNTMVSLNLSENDSWQIYNTIGEVVALGKGSELVVQLGTGIYFINQDGRSETFFVR